MHVSHLWRYPIKSLGGEPLDEAELTTDGVAGDRKVHVHDDRGPLTGRTRHQLLTIPAHTAADGTPHVAGHAWDSEAAAQTIREHAGPSARLAAYDGPERFDVLNLLVATDGAVAQLGTDVRRLRPNLLIAGVEGDEERSWPGRALQIGDALIGVHSLRQRCIVTTIDPDDGSQDVDVLRRIHDQFDSHVALNAWVIRPGLVRLGDPVDVVDTGAQPDRIGGWIVGAPYRVHAERRLP
jgi:uncharacterized protein YcbX